MDSLPPEVEKGMPSNQRKTMRPWIWRFIPFVDLWSELTRLILETISLNLRLCGRISMGEHLSVLFTDILRSIRLTYVVRVESAPEFYRLVSGFRNVSVENVKSSVEAGSGFEGAPSQYHNS